MMKYSHVFRIFGLLLLVGCYQTTELKFNDQAAIEAAGRDPASEDQSYSLNLAMGNRTYVESVLIQAFAVPENDPVRTYLQTSIYEKRDFGGGCDRYGVSEIKVGTAAPQMEFPRQQCYLGLAPELPSYSNPSRYGWTAKACEYLIYSKPLIFSGAMKQIFPNWVSSSSDVALKPESESIKRAYDLFFQSQDPSPEVVKALQDLGATAPTNDQAWKLIFTTLCVSPQWQSLD